MLREYAGEGAARFHNLVLSNAWGLNEVFRVSLQDHALTQMGGLPIPDHSL
jgi:hypothetical protein